MAAHRSLGPIRKTLIMDSKCENMEKEPYLPFKMGYLTHELMAKAEKELGETEQVKKDAILALRKLTAAEDKLVIPNDDDGFLLKYLRPYKFHPKRSFEVIQNGFRIKYQLPEICTLDYVPVFEKMVNDGVVSCLSKRNPEGQVVMIVRIAQWDPNEFALSDFLQVANVNLLYCIEDPATQVTGMHFIADCRGMSLKHIGQFTPKYLLVFFKSIQNLLPVRVAGIHICSNSTISRYIWTIGRVFLSAKLRKRVHFYGDGFDQLQKFVPKSILPTEYGGDDHLHYTSDRYLKQVRQFYERYTYYIGCGYDE